MSSGEVCPSIPLPVIKDVNDKEVQEAAKFAVEENNRIGGHCFIYKRVVNGLLYGMANIHIVIKEYILVIEVQKDDGIPWSYIAKVRFNVRPLNEMYLESFEDALKDFNRH